jgi:glutamate-1-semialdehyde 2,1-aminomutase
VHALETEGDEIAAIILEPIAGNMGVVPPKVGYLQGLRDLCDRYGVVLIFDEVISGFRVSLGGAQELYGVKPDLTTLGKIIGGGFPVGAFGGKREIMEKLAPVGPVYQAGTLSGNPVAVAAGLATLRAADASVYARVDASSAWLRSEVANALDAAGVPFRLQHAGSLFSVFLGAAPAAAPVVDYDGAKSQDGAAFAAFFHAMLDRGVHLPPSAFEAWFLSAAHDDAALAAVADALPYAAAAAARVIGA